MARITLGRGLDSLLSADPAAVSEVVEIPVDAIAPNPFQPRRGINPETLASLVRSIQENGLVQPVVVRPRGNGYQLVVGERRWRAAQKVGLATIPAIVRSATDRDALAMALIENLEREDLNAIEVAEAYDRLRREFGLTQEEVAGRVGRDRASVANYLRLLRLPRAIQDDIARGALTMGHARALLAMPTEEMQRQAHRAILERHLSVRAVEGWASSQKRRESRRPDGLSEQDPFLEEVRARLERALAARVTLAARRRGGSLEIAYSDAEELTRLLELIEGRAKTRS